jgi:predicted phosphodiesterase
MRIFALSDIHVDYAANAQWIANLSATDYRNDVLILAGDVTDVPRLFEWCLTTLALRFRRVLFVPGNHDLWVMRDSRKRDSLEKFSAVAKVVDSSGASMRAWHASGLSIIPLFGWYDYSFGDPSDELKSIWMDYHACRWPDGFREQEIAAHFDAMNAHQSPAPDNTVITFSHFLPRIDLMPAMIPPSKRILYPILGTTKLEQQLRLVNPSIHVYGHSHVNRNRKIDGVSYINNAFGYPSETRISEKRLLCIHEI